MSRAKRALEDWDALKGEALGILVETGAVSTCDLHPGVFYTNADPDAERHAYALATLRANAGEIGGTREEAVDAVKSVLDDAGWDCPACAKIMDDD
jgi:hypothetical protein